MRRKLGSADRAIEKAVAKGEIPGAVVLARHPSRWSELEDLDRRVVRIGVNAGGHLEQVARARFRRATLVSIPDNASVKKALDSHDVDAVVTDVSINEGGWGTARFDGAARILYWARSGSAPGFGVDRMGIAMDGTLGPRSRMSVNIPDPR